MNVVTNNLFRTKRQASLVVAAVALVLVFTQGISLAATEKSLVDINTASQAELEAVKGVGPATAKKIITHRPYKSLDELKKAGLSANKIESFKSFLTAGGPVAPLAPAAPQAGKMTVKETGKKGEAAPITKAKEQKVPEPATVGPVDLNTADQKALEALPGVGPATAKQIIAARPFKSVDDLSQVKGITKAKLEALQGKVTVGPAKAAPLTSTPQASPVAAKPAAPGKQATPAEPAATEKKTETATKLAPGQKVNLNTASLEDLDKLFDIGPAKAQAIIDGRPYSRIEDVMKVKGIKEGIFNKIKDNITVK
jgi:competence protein ComEA